jgi:hypothetical protein
LRGLYFRVYRRVDLRGLRQVRQNAVP